MSITHNIPAVYCSFHTLFIAAGSCWYLEWVISWAKHPQTFWPPSLHRVIYASIHGIALHQMSNVFGVRGMGSGTGVWLWRSPPWVSSLFPWVSASWLSGPGFSRGSDWARGGTLPGSCSLGLLPDCLYGGCTHTHTHKHTRTLTKDVHIYMYAYTGTFNGSHTHLFTLV